MERILDSHRPKGFDFGYGKGCKGKLSRKPVCGRSGFLLHNGPPLLTSSWKPAYSISMSAFSIESEKQRDILLVQTHGYLDDVGGDALKKLCDTALESGTSKFLIDLSDTPVINSTGLSLLLDIVVQVIDYHDGRVGLIGMTKLTRTALQMTGVLTLCEEFATVAEGTTSLA